MMADLLQQYGGTVSQLALQGLAEDRVERLVEDVARLQETN